LALIAIEKRDHPVVNQAARLLQKIKSDRTIFPKRSEFVVDSGRSI
jgi:hypothetical protein